MSSTTTPATKTQNKPLDSRSPISRRKNASPWTLIRSSPDLANNPLKPLDPTSPTSSPQTTNPLFQNLSLADTEISADPETPTPSAALPKRVVRLALSFSLLSNGVPRLPTEAEIEEVRTHFPTMTSLSWAYPLLVISVQELPARPWPTILADLPLWIKKTGEQSPATMGKFSRSHNKFTIKGEITAYHTPNETTIFEVYQLLNEKGAGIDRIRWDGLVFRAYGNQEPEQGWQNSLPRSINSFAVLYFWEPLALIERAMRLKAPSVTTTDDTQYERNELRPGVMLSAFANNMRDTLNTTSGICVESPTSGKKFITLAAHGFTASIGDSVYHPKAVLKDNLPDPKYEIATVVRKFGDTDIALAELKPDIHYSRETFWDPAPGQPSVQGFRAFHNTEELKYGDSVFMNTPFNGQCEGVYIETEWVMGIPPEDGGIFCEISHFSYWGNGSSVFFDGCCGGIMWNDNFEVIGQFRFQEKTGLQRAVCPSFQILKDKGYQISSL